jgi:hypothetical protein
LGWPASGLPVVMLPAQSCFLKFEVSLRYQDKIDKTLRQNNLAMISSASDERAFGFTLYLNSIELVIQRPKMC